MASTRAKGDMRAISIRRISQFFGLIAESQDIPAPAILEFRDKEYQEAMQLKTLADFGESLAIAMGLAEPETEAGEIVESTEPVMTRLDEPPLPLDREHLAFTPLSKLIGIAQERNIELDPKWNSQDVMEAILADNADEGDESDTDESEEPTPAQLKRMNLHDLTEYARKHGYEPEPGDTKADIRAALEVKG